MTKKIKIIDLLNKIANGEEAPKRIYYLHKEYELSSCFKNYYDKYHNDNEDLLSIISGIELNDEVEILDEEDEFEDIYLLCDNSEQYNFSSRQTGMTKEDRRLLDSNFKELLIVINQLIKNQKKIIEKLNEKKC